MKHLALSFLLLLAMTLAGGSSAWAREGKQLFRENCLACHQSAKVKQISPIDMASSQWKRFFSRQKHQKKSKVDLAANLSAQQMEEVLVYLIDHASDSDHPEVAGAL